MYKSIPSGLQLLKISKCLEEAEFEDPPKLLYKIFRNNSPKDWLNRGLGGALQIAIARETQGNTRKDSNIKNVREDWFTQGLGDALIITVPRKSQSHTKNSRIEKYFKILMEFIPQLHKKHLKVLDVSHEFYSNRYDFCNIALPTIDNLMISKTLNEIINAYVNNRDQYDGSVYLRISITLLRSIYHASQQTINNNIDAIKKLFDRSHMASYTHHYCNVDSHVFILLLFMLEEKLSESHKDILKGFLFHARYLLATNHCFDCKLMIKLRTWHNKYKHQIEDESWKLLLEARGYFGASHNNEALIIIEKMANKNSLCHRKLLQSGVLVHLSDYFKNLTTAIDDHTPVKIFLDIFANNINQDQSFKNFTMTIVKLLDSLTKQFLSIRLGGSTCDYIVNSENILFNIITSTLQVLQLLYIFNETWFHYYDFLDAASIVDKESMNKIFTSPSFNEMLDRYITKSHKRNSKIESMMSICPALCRPVIKSRMATNSLHYISLILSRDHFVADFENLINRNAHAKLVIGFENEIPPNVGPTKEAYSLISQEIHKHEFDLWQVSNNDRGLIPRIFPKNHESKDMFIFVGKLLGNAFLNEQHLDIPLSRDIFDCLGGYSHLRRSYTWIKKAFPMAKSLITNLLSVKQQKEDILRNPLYTTQQINDLVENLTFDGSSFDDLCLNFTVPGTDVEMWEGGKDIILSPFNIEEYLDELLYWTPKFYPIKELKAIKSGFEMVVPNLLGFTPKELEQRIIGKRSSSLSNDDLDSIIYHEPYTKESAPVQYLLQVLNSFDNNELKLFLKFVTGMSNLPSNGLIGFEPKLNIRKLNRDHPDNSLPAAFTCFNTIFLPEYSNLNVTREKICYAIENCQNSFSHG